MTTATSNPTTETYSLNPVLTPKASLTLKSGLRQLALFNSQRDWVLVVLGIAVSVILVLFVRPVTVWTIVVPLVYFVIAALIIVGGFSHRLIIDSKGVTRKALLQKTITYSYRDINKVILVKNLTHYDGRATRRTNGMALLIFTTDGMIPGFPIFEFGHESYFTKQQILEAFNTFAPEDRVEIEAATRADILDGIGWLRDGAKKL